MRCSRTLNRRSPVEIRLGITQPSSKVAAFRERIAGADCGHHRAKGDWPDPRHAHQRTGIVTGSSLGSKRQRSGYITMFSLWRSQASACDLVSEQTSTGHLDHQCSQAPGRPILHLVFVLSQTSAGKIFRRSNHTLGQSRRIDMLPALASCPLYLRSATYKHTSLQRAVLDFGWSVPSTFSVARKCVERSGGYCVASARPR
jgi:hypothetical protein